MHPPSGESKQNEKLLKTILPIKNNWQTILWTTNRGGNVLLMYQTKPITFLKFELQIIHVIPNYVRKDNWYSV